MWLYIFLRGQQLSQLYTRVQMVVQPDLEHVEFFVSVQSFPSSSFCSKYS